MEQLPTAGQRADFLQGGGEMGQRMRALDWAATPLGAPAGWPQSLKTAVRIMLTSRQPMFVWWGAELVNLYNDAYRAIVGGKHPGCLGQPARQVWHEIWDEVGPRAARAMADDEGTYDEALQLIMLRHGYPEETYYTFSYSPIPGDDGRPGGILCANTDDTRRIVGERQLALLRALAAATADARSYAEVATRAAASLAENRHDLPFALVYLFDEAADAPAVVPLARLAGASGLAPGTPAAPTELGDDGLWPLQQALHSHRPVLVPDLAARAGALPASAHGAWPVAPAQAVVLPIAASGERGRAGALVVGLNPYRRWDDGYRGFLELAAAQIGSGIAHAQAYEEERRRAEALAEIDRAKTAFFSNISHEFRTPLALMLGPLQELREQQGGDEPARELVRLAHRNGARLLKLVNTLLDFSRIEAGRLQARFAPLDLAALTAELASGFRAAVEKAGMTLTVDCPPLPQPVYVDRDLWEKVVLNLLSNAFKYTLQGGIEVRLRAGDDGGEHRSEQGSDHGGEVRLQVADTGSGIAAEHLPRLFERFHRIEGAPGRTQEGSGIGLALVQELVKLHGGRIEVDSEPGRGTCFTVVLRSGSAHLPPAQVSTATPARPAATAAADAYVEEALRWVPDAVPDTLAGAPPPAGPDSLWAGLESQPPVAAPATDDAPRPRVLLADDNADMRAYVRHLLAPLYEVQACADGEQALAAARRAPPDLVLSDVMMPRLDGFGLLQRLRADERTASLPVILLSARAGEEARIEGLNAGADDYVVKPFSARELLARVGSALTVARLRREALQREAQLKAETASVLDSIGDGFIALDARFRITYVNAAAERQYGVAREASLGQTPWQLFPGLAGAPFQTTLEQVAAVRQPAHFELRYAPAERVFEVHAYPRPQGLTVYFRDITARQQREQQLRDEVRHSATLNRISGSLASARELPAIVRAVVDGGRALTGAQAGAFFHRNPSAEGEAAASAMPPPLTDALGPSVPASATGAPIADAYAGLPVPPAGDVFAGLPAPLPNGGVVRLDDDTPPRAGAPCWPGAPQAGTRWRSYLAVPVRGSQGEWLGALCFGHAEPGRFGPRHEQLIIGVAAQAAIAIDNARLVRRLRDSADRLGLALSAGELGDWRWDALTDAVELSPRAAQIFGVDPFAALTWKQMQPLLHDDDREATLRAVERSVADRARYSAEYRVRHADGREVWVAAWGMPHDAAGDGRVTGMFGVFQDITATKHMERELRERAQALAEADRRKDEFLATLAHELRNPLAPLRNALEILRHPGLEERMREQARSIMARQVGQMARLIDELIDIARITSGRIALQPESLPLAALVEAAIEIARPQIDDRHQRLALRLPDTPVHLQVDRTRIAQVLSNLLHNAAKFSATESEIVLEAEATADGGLDIAVQDRGRGLAPEMLGRVFEMFVQVPQADATPAQAGGQRIAGGGGLGVGLTLARRLAELHGGSLTAHSEGLGHGSRFVVHLPAACVLPDAPPADASGDDDLAPAHRLRVLVVDDNVDAAESLVALLRPDGHDIAVAHDGVQALEAAQRLRPDVVLLDIGLPRLGGDEVARRLRAQPGGAALLLVATTGWGQVKDRERSREAGFDHHLVKPVDPLAIRRLLARAQPAQAAAAATATATATATAPPAGNMAAAMDMTAMNEAAMTNGDPATPDDSGLRVLVADDNALVRESFVQLLESEGFEVRTAVDGEQAVQVADEWQPRVVMLDIHMPGLNGLDAARRLRERHPHEQMTLLMMSGMTLNDAWLRLAKSAGFDDCVDKTSDPQQWLPRLREAPAALRDPA